MQTSLKQKFWLVFFGLVLTVILLEAGLRIAGAIVLYLQERHNHISYAPDEYRILCLGESTTALGGEDSFPSQLEEMLNAHSPHIKFTVINKGLISTTTEYILKHLEKNLDSYKPQLVVLMMGVNDAAYLNGPAKSLWQENIKSFLKNLRVYKLTRLLYAHITHRITEIHTPKDMLDVPQDDHQQIENFLEILITKLIKQYQDHSTAAAQYQQKGQAAQARQKQQLAKNSLIATSLACIQLAQRYRLEGRLPEAQNVLKMATSLNANDADLYQEWGELYLGLGQLPQAEKAFQLTLVLDPKNGYVLQQLARVYYQEHKPEAFLAYAKYLQIKPQDYWGYIELARWFSETGHDVLAREYLGQAIKVSPDLDQAYADMGQLYKEAGRQDLAQEFLQKAAKHESYGFRSVTFINYALILNKILSRNIKVIVMQYPLRDIDPLKDYLGQREGVFFVENKQNFKQAVAKEGFSHYFKDNFAYNFGHCTRAGNELIAKNLTDVILQKVLASP